MPNDQIEVQPQSTAPTTGGPSPLVLGDLGSEPRSPAAPGNGGVPMPSFGVLAGGVALGLGADVSQQMLDTAPVFGDVLSSIGNGVAASQAALDKSIVDTVKTLNDTKIDVITDVIEQLDDNGLPDVAQTTLVKQNLSVLNFFTPTVHEWKEVSLSMDLEVAALDNENGFTFHKEQSSSYSREASLFWGFLGWFDGAGTESTYDYTARSHNESAWSRGQIRMDALLGPRRTTKFPIPATISTGPQIYFSQGRMTEKVVDEVVTERSVDLLITVRKANGEANSNVSLVVDAAGLVPDFKTDGGFDGSTTNADGKVQVKLTRPLSFGFARAAARTVTVSLGQLRKSLKVVV